MVLKPPRCFSCTWCGVFRRPFRVIFGLIEIGLAVGIIVITSFHLTNYDVDLSEGTVTNYKCLLGTTDSGDDICVYTYVMSGIAIGAAILLMISAIFTCACWLYFDFVLDFIISVLAAILWFVVAAVITDYNNNQVQSETDVQKSWRNAVTTMSWVLFGLFCVDAVGSSFRFLYKACGCCGGYEAARLVEVEEELKKKDEELANLRAQLTLATGPPQPQAMEVKPDPANPGQVAVAVADSNGATPAAPAAPDTAPAKSTLYPPVPPAGAIPP